MAGVFEEDILHGGSLGLERKVRLARTIAVEWLDDDAAGYGRLIGSAKSYRDQIAHWPTRLEPIENETGTVVDYVAHIEKGGASTSLTAEVMASWHSTIEDANSRTQDIIERIENHIRSGAE